MYYSSSGSDIHHDRHRYHPYRRNDRGYLPNEFKKEKPPNFDRYVKNSEDAKAWINGMNKFFEFQEYKDNMKAREAIFSSKGKTNI